MVCLFGRLWGIISYMSFLETIREHLDSTQAGGEAADVWARLYRDATAAAQEQQLSPVVEANLVRAAISRCRTRAGEHVLAGRISDAQAASNTATQLNKLLPTTLNREQTRTIIKDIIDTTGATEVDSVVGWLEDRADIDQGLLVLIAHEELEESQAEHEAEASENSTEE